MQLTTALGVRSVQAISNVMVGPLQYLDTLHLIAHRFPLSFDISYDGDTLHFEVVFEDTPDKIESVSVSGVEGKPLHGLITFKNIDPLASSVPVRDLLMGILADHSLFMLCSVKQIPSHPDLVVREITMSFYLGASHHGR